MKRWLCIGGLLLLGLCAAQRAAAQYYSWGSDHPSLKWSRRGSRELNLLYPDTVGATAARVLFYGERIRPWIGYGFTRPPLRVPVVMHPENFRSNGMAMWLPKRIEFLTTPETEGYAMPWHKQLIAHEYRHAVQYNNLNRGTIRLLSWLLGQQGQAVGLLYLPLWLLEGDAVLSETDMAAFGRGLQPSFTIAYRALGREVLQRRNPDLWFCGSYRRYVPDHYHLGYQIAAYSWVRYDENIWDRVARFGARYPFLFFTNPLALRRYAGTDVRRLYRETFSRLNDWWEPQDTVRSSSRVIRGLPACNYTVYRWPVALGDSLVAVHKSDLKRPPRFVAVDPATGRERPIARTGSLSTRPDAGRGRIWWTEYRRSLLFDERVNSQLCYLDLADGRPRTVRGVRRALYPTVTDRGIAWVEYAPDGRYTVVHRTDDGAADRLPLPLFTEVHGLAWDDRTGCFCLLLTDDDGMRIAAFGADGRLRSLTPPSRATLSSLRARNGRLYFGSIASGKDEVHTLDLATGRQYRLTESRYGGFDPAPLADSVVVLTDYTAQGYRLARQAVDTLRPVAWAALPANLVNPPRRRWAVIDLDTVRYTPADSARLAASFPARRYRKGLGALHIHSWAPVAANPFELIEEHRAALNAGVTLLSQNLLSNTVGYASWGWSRTEGSVGRIGIRYTGWGVRIDLDGQYGGRRLVYGLMQWNPDSGQYDTQPQPPVRPYGSAGVRLQLPLHFQRGSHTQQLQLAAGWNWSNGLVADLGQLRYDDEQRVVNLESVGYRKGLHKLAFTAGFSDLWLQAPQEFAPRWGYACYADYALNPANRHFSDLVSLYAKVWLPGIVRPHALTAAVNWQTSVGGYRMPSGQPVLTYKSVRLLPRGFSSAAIASNRYIACSVDYQLPLWYPEGGIPSVLYIKRVRLNAGFDWACFRSAGRTERLWSCGGDLLFDLNLFRLPAAATTTLKLSFYRPSAGPFFFTAGIGLPF